MAKYVIKFSKEGYICYISHLDMLRLFKRAMKKAEIPLVYSQGFNPHPKLGFAQPLSLGYSSIAEYLEFETTEEYPAEKILKKMKAQMPVGINLFFCKQLPQDSKNLAAMTEAAEYLVGIPMHRAATQTADEMCEAFLAQKSIMVPKRQKKTKKFADTEIRDKIQFLQFILENDNLIMTTILDSGSSSNLSPELLILAIQRFFELDTDRTEINVMRTKIMFGNNIQI